MKGVKIGYSSSTLRAGDLALSVLLLRLALHRFLLIVIIGMMQCLQNLTMHFLISAHRPHGFVIEGFCMLKLRETIT